MQWARELGQRCDKAVKVPVHACEHFYAITQSVDWAQRLMPGEPAIGTDDHLQTFNTLRVSIYSAHIPFSTL